MKVYVIFDPLYETNKAVYKDYKKAWDECERLNKEEDREKCAYYYEAQDFEMIED